MARKGLLNCYIDGHGQHHPYQTAASPIFNELRGYGNAYISQEMYVTLFNYFSSPDAQSLGIQRRAYFRGGQTQNLCFPMPEETTSSAAGTGTAYWDQPNPMGNHAWAAFEFTQGSPAFWIMLQWGAASTIDVFNATYGYTLGAPGFGLSGSGGQASGSIGSPYTNASINANNISMLQASNHSRLAGVGISVAFMNDGSSPWNGTTNDNGTDTKGAPLWKNNAMVFPRANNDRGTFASSKDLMFGLLYEQNCVFRAGLGDGIAGAPQRNFSNVGFDAGSTKQYDDAAVLYHTILEEDKFCILVDHSGIGLYSMLYYGPYVPYVSGNIAPRIALHKYTNNNDAAGILSIGNNQVYGGFDMGQIISSNQYADQTSGDTCYHQGGVTHPMSASVVGCSLDTFPYSNFDSPRRFQTDIRGPWLTSYPLVYMNEFPERRSLLGEIRWFSIISNLPSNALLNAGTLAAFGNPEMGTFKAVVPWFTGSQPGIYGSRLGQAR